MYKIIGGDQKEYGPVSFAEICQWILEGRANGQTLAKGEGDADWKPLAAFTEFAQTLAARAQTPPAMSAPPALGLPANLMERDYDLSIGNCISRGCELLKNNFGVVFGGTALFFVIQVAISLLGSIPIVGLVISLASFVIAGPFMGGLYYFFLRNIRGRGAIEDIFAGFRMNFVQLMLGYIVSMVISILLALPGIGIIFFSIFAAILRQQPPTAGQFVGAGLGALVSLIPMIYLAVSWLFSLPLIIDKQMDFWRAMETSRKVVGRHWWTVFALLIVTGLINLGGMLVCCIGLLFTMPIALGAITYAYEDIFCAPAAPATGSADRLGLPGV
jgi:uncharacterized protein DUF4339/glycerophosphoryl diester phosphodiesterase family protein